ncbi:chemotaxis protein CheB [Taibaiella chishuiensis]|uniref:protein-glutamate methylesterase n=1 Tax=Taibaiella chishuiensis TaxID=1434707 RepID=A0A2P8CXU1_9BACT|nr:chemotaxis protein CheB [Taibaiella chishuiensis]PSK89746.1 CheB methylesterase [Taibaiella chishuiensis]
MDGAGKVKDVILIGGSAGSLPIVMRLLTGMPPDFSASVIIILHRLKNAASDMDQLLSRIAGIPVEEPDDKTRMERGRVYLAPANYHLLADEEDTISLDYSEPELHSRPSINITFASFAAMYGSRVTALLLSGSNSDGAAGLKAVLEHNGSAVIQDPLDCEYPVMPEYAAVVNPGVTALTVDEIDRLFKSIVL